MARTITVQATLDDDVIKSAEAMLAKLGMDMGGFVALKLKQLAAERGQPAEPAQAGAGESEREAKLAAFERLKKCRVSVPDDFCYKTELAKARDEKYADYV